ncbi:MAG TPA: HD domain-containing protein [Candidatus Paceibacterota bacterium]|nr:HD domain-containing protein [Candidatus Paceibacterota bacterium]
MNHTPEIKKAIQFAARKHHDQMRLEAEPLPYITHLISAALLVAEDGDVPDEVVIATLLHDTLEDTQTNEEELARAFGSQVLALVKTVTEPKEIEDWKERKKRYLAQLTLGSDDALLISMADKIDNIESKLEAYAREGPALLKRFHDQKENEWYHGAVLRMGQERLPAHPLTKRLAQAHAKEKEMLS